MRRDAPTGPGEKGCEAPAVSNCAGFSLVGAMIIAVFICVAIMGSLSALISSVREDQKSREISIALNAARLKLEEIRADTFANIVQDYNGGSNGAGTTFTVAGLKPRSGQTTQGTVRACDHYDATNEAADSAGCSASLILVTVTIQWTGAWGVNGEYVLKTKLAKWG